MLFRSWLHGVWILAEQLRERQLGPFYWGCSLAATGPLGDLIFEGHFLAPLGEGFGTLRRRGDAFLSAVALPLWAWYSARTGPGSLVAHLSFSGRWREQEGSVPSSADLQRLWRFTERNASQFDDVHLLCFTFYGFRRERDGCCSAAEEGVFQLPRALP